MSRLRVPLLTLQRAAEEFGTPFHVYDEGAMVANAKRLLTAMRERFPDFQQYFAVKALPNPSILQILLACGCGLDCSSRSELIVAARLGVPGYAPPLAR